MIQKEYEACGAQMPDPLYKMIEFKVSYAIEIGMGRKFLPLNWNNEFPL